jgi:hypothetical protein
VLAQTQRIVYSAFGLWLLGGPLSGPLIAVSDLIETVARALAQALEGVSAGL